MAGDAEDAVELLSYALKCPRKPVTTGPGYYDAGATSTALIFTLLTVRYVGDAHQMVIEKEVTFDNRAAAKWTERASFADLYAAFTVQQHSLSVQCSPSHYGCFKSEATEANGQRVDQLEEGGGKRITAGGYTVVWPDNSTQASLELCDAETAKRAKLAIDTLIQLNKLRPPIDIDRMYHNWQLRCQTRPNSAADQCALAQTVVSEEAADIQMTSMVFRSENHLLMRFLVPHWALLPAGLGLKIDDNDIGRAGYSRCDADGCIAEVVVDEQLLARLKNGKVATVIIAKTSAELIGIPFSLEGFGSGLSALP